MNNKGLSEVITTVLMIVLGLAAVAIIATVVLTNVNPTGCKLEAGTACSNIELNVIRCNSNAVSNSSVISWASGNSDAQVNSIIVKLMGLDESSSKTVTINQPIQIFETLTIVNNSFKGVAKMNVAPIVTVKDPKNGQACKPYMCDMKGAAVVCDTQ